MTFTAKSLSKSARKSESLTKQPTQFKNMDTFNITNRYLSFEGTNEDAYNLITELREAYRSGSEMNKTLSDWIWSIELMLQNRGFIDENFNLIKSFKVTFTNDFVAESKEEACKKLLDYLKECVKYEDVTTFDFEEIP
jgi:hypothetical protein